MELRLLIFTRLTIFSMNGNGVRRHASASAPDGVRYLRMTFATAIPEGTTRLILSAWYASCTMSRAGQRSNSRTTFKKPWGPRQRSSAIGGYLAWRALRRCPSQYDVPLVAQLSKRRHDVPLATFETNLQDLTSMGDEPSVALPA